MPERFRPEAHRRPMETTEEMLDHFRDIQRKLGLDTVDLHETFFIERVDGVPVRERVTLDQLRALLRRIDQNPQPAVISGLREAFALAKADHCPAHARHLENLRLLETEDPNPAIVEKHLGAYRFWRIGRFELIDGRLVIMRHEESSFPCFVQTNRQKIARSGQQGTFAYSGDVAWVAHNVLMSSVASNEFRHTILRRVRDPRRTPMLGVISGVEPDADEMPFASPILVCHEDWCEQNSDLLTEEWIRRHLDGNGDG